MNRKLLTGCAALLIWHAVAAQDSLKVWTLQTCLDYALENNIQLQQSRNDYLSGLEDTREAKAALLPSLAVSATQGYTNYPSSNAEDNNSYTGTYGINAEAVEVAAGTAEVSRAQRDRAEQMWQAGSISKVDFAQLESQYASDLYQVVVARSSLDDYKLQLKQLLELDITEEMNLAAPAEGEETVLQALPAKTDIYATALDAMPQIERRRLGVETAELGIREARAGFYPSVSLTAGLGTGHMTGGGFQSGSQVWNRFNENVALSVSIPIFSNRKNRTAVNKARIAASNSRLEQLGLKKELLRKVESAYLDAISSQSRYTAARQKERYARQSYDLTDEQFRVGRKNTVELITAQNELSSARQEVLQAKYMALLNIRLLDIYQGR